MLSSIRSYRVTIRIGLLALALLLLLAACSSSGRSSSATADPVVTQGERVFEQNCATCHSARLDMAIVGPSLAGVASRAGTRIEGLTAEEYIRQSITRPGAYVVDGFADLMPGKFGRSLSDEQLDALIAYLLTLK